MTQPDEAYDAGRDALALVRAIAAGDDEGADAILNGASLRDLTWTLAGMVDALLKDHAAMTGHAGDVTGMLDALLVEALGREHPQQE